MLPRRCRIIGAILLAALPLGTRARAFVTLNPGATVEAAARWSAAPHASIDGAGLYDGIQVAITPGFASALVAAVTGGSAPEDLAAVETAVAAAFAAWRSPVLTFALTFDGSAVRGTAAGAEIDLFAVPDSDPAFASNSFFGVTSTHSELVADRLLTNGAVVAGNAFTRTDILLNLDMLALVAPGLTREQQLAALQRLLMHEIGHAIGLNHPNEFPSANRDTDLDPLNEMVIDPDDPFADILLSPNVDAEAIVSNGPSFFGLLLTTLRNDDRGGRDVLYPARGVAGRCSAAARSGCRTAGQSLLLLERPGDAGDRLTWKWIKGQAISPTDLGDPRATTSYALCVYAGTPSSLVVAAAIPPDAARWKPIASKGFKYAGAPGGADGIARIVLKSGAAHRAKMMVQGNASTLPQSLLPVTVQLTTSDTPVCWQGIYDAGDVVENEPERLKLLSGN